MKRWRHTLHQMPEFGFETLDTAAFIVAKLNNIVFLQERFAERFS